MTDPNIGLIRYEDILQPFMLHNSQVRGRMVRIREVIDTILTRHQHPEIVNQLLGEMLCIAAMLASNLPEDGILTIQAKGDGPISFLVVDAAYGGALRGYANVEDHAAIETVTDNEEIDATTNLQQLMGNGYLAITFDTGHGDPYQGIVPLEGETVTQAVEQYFNQSQQLDVMLKIFVNQRIREDGSARWSAGGIMLERMPDEGGVATPDNDNHPPEQNGVSDKETSLSEDLESWKYNALLVDTATEEELLDPHLAPSALLYRLFNEKGVWIGEEQSLNPDCRCSRQKIIDVLSSMDHKTLSEMQEDGVITVTCQFCNSDEVFNEQDLESFKKAP